MMLDTLILRDRMLRLKEPVRLVVERGADFPWVVTCVDLGGSGVGHSIPEAVADLSETFWWVYFELARTPKDQLHQSAASFLKQVDKYIPSEALAA